MRLHPTRVPVGPPRPDPLGACGGAGPLHPHRPGVRESAPGTCVFDLLPGGCGAERSRQPVSTRWALPHGSSGHEWVPLGLCPAQISGWGAGKWGCTHPPAFPQPLTPVPAAYGTGVMQESPLTYRFTCSLTHFQSRSGLCPPSCPQCPPGCHPLLLASPSSKVGSQADGGRGCAFIPSSVLFFKNHV